MRGCLRRKLAELCGCTSGNATILVAMGMPMLIGGAGLGVDLAQWYMWKRELQFAVDQAALAGAWAQSSADATVQGTYLSRAQQEYNANLSVVDTFDAPSGPTIALAPYPASGSTNNSVRVTTSATKKLPFSSMLTGGAATISVRAQATFQGAVNFQACMLALNPSAQAAFQLGNSVSGTSACGAGTLSNHPQAAMKETGDTTVPLGTVVSAGAVDDTFANNGTIYEDQENLSDPYDELSPPSSAGRPDRTYPSPCPLAQPASTTYTANGSTRTHFTYQYYQGANRNNWTLQTSYNGTGFIADSWSSWVAFTDRAVPSGATTGIQAETSAAEGTEFELAGNGSNTFWRLPFTSTQDDYTLVTENVIPASDGTVQLEPGIYESLSITCTTVFSPGIYYIAGDLDFGQNQQVTGTGGVMFVLLNAGDIHVNANSNVTLSGITDTTLIDDYGVDPDEAAQLAGMLIWDPTSTDAFTWNGNATLNLSGVLYMPNREATFNGSASASGSCIMVAADILKITGNFSLNNFCVAAGGAAMGIGGGVAKVRLVV